MNPTELKYFRQAEKAFTSTEENFDEASRGTESNDSDIFLLILAELKRTNDLLRNISRKLGDE